MIPAFSPQKGAYRGDSLSLVRTAALGSLRGFQFTDGGSSLRWSDASGSFRKTNPIYSAPLSTDYDVSTTGSTTKTDFTVSATNTTRIGFESGFLYRDAGATLIAASYSSLDDFKVFDFSVSPAYTGTETENHKYTDSTASAYGLFLFSDAGAKFHIAINRAVYVASFSTDYDVSTMGSLSLEKDMSADVSADIKGMCWGRSEKVLLLTDGADLLEYSLAVAGNISTVGSATSLSWSVPSTAYGIGYADGGRKFYATGGFGIQQYDAVA